MAALHLGLGLFVAVGCIAGTAGPARVGPAGASGDAAEITPGTSPPPAVPPVRAEWLSCGNDLDCVTTAADCCGCAGGGRESAIAAPWVDARAAELRRVCRHASPCPTVRGTACTGASPVCREGRCELD